MGVGHDDLFKNYMSASKGYIYWRVRALIMGVLVLSLTGCQTTGAVHSTPSSQKEQYLLSLVDRNFQDPQAQYLLAQYYHTEGRLDKALYQIDLALRFGPYFRKAQVAKVRYLLEQDKSSLAQEAVGRFVKQSAHNPDGLIELAKTFQQEGLDQYALYCLEQARTLCPKSPLVFKELGLYHLAKDQTTRAREYLLRSFELDPTQADVAGTLGRLGVVVEVPKSPSSLPPKM